jgi:D-sedoheptulose 7-phosphate isomerase
LTCFANDYGYEEVFEAQLNRHKTGTLVAISSSGRSKNILNAVRYALPTMTVVTFSGFDKNNPLRDMGNINYYVPSHNYGIVEVAHLTILHSLVKP